VKVPMEVETSRGQPPSSGAESFGSGSAHRVLVQAVGRPPAAGAAPLLLAWREIR